MPEYVRVATFEGDASALVNEIASSDAPPPGVPAKAITVLADRAGGRARVVLRFASEDDLSKASETLDGMNPPGNVRRSSVETWEVLFERQA